MKSQVMLLVALVMLVGSATGYAERPKMQKLKAADPPCLFLMDEESGELVGDAVNPPCDLGGASVNEGDEVAPSRRQEFGQTRTMRPEVGAYRAEG